MKNKTEILGIIQAMKPELETNYNVKSIGIFGSVADGIFAMSHSPMGQAMIKQPHSQSDLTFWNVVYYLWPKLSGAQQFASSLINREGFQGLLSLYPLINVLIYVLVFGALLFWRFSNEDII